MSTQKFYQPVKQRFPKRPIKELAKLISFFPPSPSSCSNFFNFKQSPNLETHLALVVDLLKSKEFAEAENILNAVVVTDGLRKPVSKIASLLSENHVNRKVMGKMFNMLFSVYVNNMRFTEALQVFDYMKKGRFRIDDRACMVYLLAMKRQRQYDSLFEFFHKMVEFNVKITVYSMTVVVDGLCKMGEVCEARKLVDEMASKGVKPSDYTYNILLQAYMKIQDFVAVKEILRKMEKDGFDLNLTSYTLLIKGYSTFGDLVEVERLFKEIEEKGIEPNVHLCTSMISGYSKLGNVMKAFSTFVEMVERGLSPDGHTYGALINGFCKAGLMQGAEVLLNEMQGKGISIDRVIFNRMMDG